MKSIPLTVNRSILEAKEDLEKITNETITKKLRTLFASATGTYKTTYAVELVKEKGDQFYFIIMEPQISISGQLSQRLADEGIPVFMYNGQTRRNIDWWINVNRVDGPFCIVSTIDSTWRLFEEEIVDPEKTIVIADEFHSFLQNARDYFDLTVRTILDSGCPIIGLTATETSWVSEKLFNVDTVVRIEATEIPPKVIQPYLVSRGQAPFVAKLIESNEWERTVIWTYSKKDQRRIQAEINIKLPHLKTAVMNADTRDSVQMKGWEYIKEQAKLPSDIDVFIGNGVMQAGISILDADIDAVILVGQFEPLGFQQYLGRCRNFTGTNYYIHLDYGKDEISWKGAAKLEEFTDAFENFYKQFTEDEIEDIMEVNPLLRKYYFFDNKNGYTLKRCMVANEFYSSFSELNGKHLLNYVGQLDPSLIIEDYNRDPISRISEIPKAQKADYRRKQKRALPELVERNANSLNGLIKFFKQGMRHQTALKVISSSVGNKKKAVNENLFHLHKNKKKGLVNTIETAYKAGVGMQRLLLAAKAYINNRYDSKAIEKVMKMSNSKVSKLIKASHFFEDDYPSNKKVKDAVDYFAGKVNMVMSADDWKREISKQLNGSTSPLLQIPGKDELANTLYESCFITKRKKVRVDAKYSNERLLINVVKTYPDYITANGLDTILS